MIDILSVPPMTDSNLQRTRKRRKKRFGRSGRGPSEEMRDTIRTPGEIEDR